MLPCEDAISGVRIDFVFSVTPYERSAIDRAHEHLLNGVAVKFASPDDIIVHKLVAGRPRDRDDVKSILLKLGSIDLEYVRHWLRQFEETTNHPLGEHARRFAWQLGPLGRCK